MSVPTTLSAIFFLLHLLLSPTFFSNCHVLAFSPISLAPPPHQRRSFLTLRSTTTSFTSFEFPEDAFPEKHNNKKNNKFTNTQEEGNDHSNADSSSSSTSSSSSSEKNKPLVSLARQRRMQEELDIASRFVTGDEVHKLRQQVLSLRIQLDEARSENKKHPKKSNKEQIHRLERAILDAQQRDAEFIYEMSLERMQMAQRAGLTEEALQHQAEAARARSALPHFQLTGLWVGKYGDHGFELINVTYSGDTLIAYKVTGLRNVAKGQVTFQVDLSPLNRNSPSNNNNNNKINNNKIINTNNNNNNPKRTSSLEPIELGTAAASQWGARFLSRFAGQGRVAAADGSKAQWLDGQLILVGDQYFSFAWLPIGHQVFFGRPSPELTLKLLRECRSASTFNKDETVRQHIERCWEETEHIEDELEVSSSSSSSSSSSLLSSSSSLPHQHANYYHQEGCFE